MPTFHRFHSFSLYFLKSNLGFFFFSSPTTWEHNLWLAVKSEVVQLAINIYSIAKWSSFSKLSSKTVAPRGYRCSLAVVSLYELSLAWLLAVRLANSHDATLELFYLNQHSLELPVTGMYVPGEIHCVSASPACFPPLVSGTTQPRNLFFPEEPRLGRFRANNN